MRYMIIMRGLPGSGKSTKAKVLADKLRNSVILSTDTVFMSGEKYLFCPEVLGMAHQINLAKAAKAVKLGYDVIVDNTNTTWKEIEPYVKVGLEAGYVIEITEPSTAWAHNVLECAAKNSHGVPATAIRRMQDRWETAENINKLLNGYKV
jgi:2',3'-cyclic-nucleotide 3'-phosphodiesterase